MRSTTAASPFAIWKRSISVSLTGSVATRSAGASRHVAVTATKDMTRAASVGGSAKSR